ncbi:NAD(P)H-binding protein [Streptomyces sp. MP131-18]|uniref:NAD(P)H-binding protein n=1 Tax=Streptomyces sp. MP131-18 TaxID=1857892 RepID=UPI00097BDCC3|nr:NAD(P)H-binding protein [Streptomyces sp. MP131-18]ONK15539.1 putative NADH-flavin reductase [Streptomyces sp. MP131-18]
MKLVVFGANGPTGRMATAMAMAAGHSVTAITRRPLAFPFNDVVLQIAAADVLDADAVDWVMAGQDAVISAIGAPVGSRDVSLYSRGTYNIVKAMVRHGLRRVVCVSSAGVAGTGPPDGAPVSLGNVRPLLRRRWRGVHQDMRRMESIVRASSLDWTIVRPAVLFDDVTVTDYRVTGDGVPGRYTSRADLAHALLTRAVGSRDCGRTIHVVTTGRTPGPAVLRPLRRAASKPFPYR